ncbi:DNA repair protein RecN [Phocaeicola barnesiae]|jgi:DNA repair protein RecN (Recombination protein N)|uniref:DNA repair protein RecN n=1 Tax=Phocaeicola barnesiae TaxID=376804 RepID=A0AAW5N7I4_9BACT|nr:DNA repair protein RecN [Phocaeicola barnesiae]MBS6469696.1 DNA repair protein RecN [Bacteroides sp.]MCF2597677.1 DNA repair protein RecN [Phocaeicola barnesiae]MCR8874040.1 DNA repair protein RecN [Phocaeicola barnesiae]MDM8232383.1 DNA repair protein RecN [Phocaeicola barnesiae]MDM8241712.1 DNA repair protein RecN [Phocaeicola barnesiae]
MLQAIYIQNYALIDKLDIDFTPGFSVITGETGAGKSIILGAIGLLLGQRADVKAIKNGATKCIVEARFRIATYGLEDFFAENDIEYDEEECIIRREVSANGKSRAFINDTPASLSQMKILGEKLIDVHSQHQNLLLNKEGFQLNILDILAQDEKELSDYQKSYREYRQVCHDLEDFIVQAEKSRQDEDYLRFQLEQLEEANLQAGEQVSLEQEAETLSHAEDILAGLYKAGQLMDGDENGTLALTKECIQTLQNVSKVYPPAQEWLERLDSCYIELKDLAREISGSQEAVEFNPARLDFVNERLNLIYTLQQKHHVKSVEELIALTADYRMRLDAITSFDERIAALRNRQQELYQTVLQKAEVLTEVRTRSARYIESQMESLLVPLGMPNVRFAVELSPRKEPDAKGMDSVTFLFSANKNGTLQNVASIASGGEIARVMLSLKAMIAGAVKLPTIIFDEIDTGVSGSIAEKMALIMQDMGRQNRQVISITHLPQIAARGIAHYKVYKEDTETGTNSHIRRLSDEERVQEIAHMLSGATLTEAAMNNARALLGYSQPQS